MSGSIREALKRFKSDARGNIAVIFALTATPILGLVGGAVDYSNAMRMQTALQAAYDAAALAGARRLRDGDGAVRQEVQNYLNANLPPSLRNVPLKVEVLDNRSSVRVSTDGVGQVQTTFLGLMGIQNFNIKGSSTTTLGAQEIEIALVLDNTGSMVNDMAALRNGAIRMTQDVMALGSGVRVAVVPYVAAVNVGRANLPLSMVDTQGLSDHHGRWFKTRQIARMDNNCRFPWEINPGGGGGGGGGGGNPDNGSQDRGDLAPTSNFASLFERVFGPRRAHATGATVTPNTIPPYTGPFIQSGVQHPSGFNVWNNCGLYNPTRISHLDLFARIPGAQWKGCVEARPEPHDVTDTPPRASDPNTLFVPYFWPDEPDKFANWVPQYENDYMQDGPGQNAARAVPGPAGWRFDGGDWDRAFSLFKYDGSARARIDETGPNTTGPNKACGDEIVPLTNNQTTVMNRLRGLTHWNGGGTISSEGVMWGWRVLSPGPPFTEGRPYGEVPKIMVVMSDGQNMVARNNEGGPTMSDYSAYGYLRYGRFPQERFDRSQEYLDQRQALACTNAKREGIIIYTILFRERAQRSRDIMRNCASEGRFYYEAITPGELERAFADIAANISRLRISR